jgi:hypothetical protein
MKKALFISLMLIGIMGCQKKELRYTQNSPEIELYKKAIKDYELGNWDALASAYAADAKIGSNATEKNAVSVAANIVAMKEGLTSLASYNFVAEDNEYEMVVTDKGETWVNFWGVWQGRLKANNELIETPVHLTAQFVDGKIVKEFGYWDNAPMVLAIQKLQAEAPLAVTEAPAEQTEATKK